MAEEWLKKPYYPDVHLYKAVAQDKRLSLEARGLYVMMMSLPDDWEFCVSGLATIAGCGKDRIRRLLGQLEEVGYLLREQSHDAGGKFAKNVYVLQSFAPPSSGNPDNGKHRCRETPSSVKTVDGNPDTKEYVNNINISPLTPQGGSGGDSTKKKKRKRNGSTPQYKPDWFERFWAKYPPRDGRKDHRKEAIAAWDKLQPSLELCRVMSKALEPKNWPRRWFDENGRYIPLASTWLNGRRWEVEYAEQPSIPPDDLPPTSPPRVSHQTEINGEQVIVFG